MTAIISHLWKLNKLLDYKKLICNSLIKKTGRRWSSRYFLTTPIFYVNAEPHIGHLYTALIGDASSRFQKLKNPNLKSKYMVGTDEHGLKVSQSAAANKLDVKSFCGKISNKYKEMFELFNIQYDDFVRTTEDRHIKAATALWNKISSKNLIYSDNYSGWYSVVDEMFVSEQNLDPKVGENGERYTAEGQKQVFFMEEVNYKFKLKGFKNDLLSWAKGDVVKPNSFNFELIKWIEDEKILNDISVSRPVERVSWGIPVPGDPSQTIYVWLDALSSYLCASGYPDSNFKWPPDVQIVGKDILRFHGVFWPAFLMAADLEPPKCIFCHSHWMKDDEKMSKSRGNVVDPFESAKQLTSDGLRYFLLRGGVPHNDGNFSSPKIIAYLNAELADSLGNLLLRCTGVKINPNQIFPSLFDDYQQFKDDACNELINALEELPEKVTTHFEEFNFYKGVDEIMAVLHITNKFFQDRSPWKSGTHCREHINLTLHFCMESLRCCGILLQPIVPNTCTLLLNKLSVPVRKRNLTDIRPFSWESSKEKDLDLMSGACKLFPKIQAG